MKPSYSIRNNNNGTWTVRVGVRLSETEYFSADLHTTSDYDVCRRLFNLNWATDDGSKTT